MSVFRERRAKHPICLCGEVVKTQLKRFGYRKKIFEVTLQESDAHALSQPLVLRWFNLHYVQKMILTGQRLVVFGKPRLRGQRLCMEHPEFEVIENDEEISIHFRRITPIYPATEGLSQRVLRGLIYRVSEEFESDDRQTFVAAEIGPRRSCGAPCRKSISRTVDERSPRARETLVLAEFFAMQMLLASRRSRSRAQKGAVHCGPGRFAGALSAGAAL